MNRTEAEQLLLHGTESDGEADGRYLVRESSRTKGQMTLSLRFSSMTKNYRLYHDDAGQHYVNELKKFDTLHDLVADGLITLYMELHAGDYIANLTSQCRYEESPYMTLVHNRAKIVMSQAQKQPPQPQKKFSPNQTKTQSGASSSSGIRKPSSRLSLDLNAGSSYIQNSSSPVANSNQGLQPQSTKPNRRSIHGCGGVVDNMIIKPITSHEELAAPDDDNEIYVTPCNYNILMMNSGSGIVNVQAFEKAHNFRTHTFIGNPWCDYCGNFIWGIIGQGVRCDGQCLV